MSWQDWIFVGILIVAVILAVIYPYQPQPENVVQGYEQAKEEGVIMVFYPVSKGEAVKRFQEEYPDYKIQNMWKVSKGTWIKGVKK